MKSMTGFGSSDGARAAVRWHWEVRSVNGRGLDLRLRVPPGFEALEAPVRELASQAMARGSVAINLTVERSGGTSEIRINEAALDQVLRAVEQVRVRTGGEPPRIDVLLGLRGVLELSEVSEDEAERQALHTSMLAGFHTALSAAVEARAVEGARLRQVFDSQIADMEVLVAAVETAPGRQPEVIKARISDLVAKLLDTGQTLDADRLHQEAVLIATRADVEEELKRLRIHIASARQLLADGAVIGRKLDFLAQEFNREANTLTSKAPDTDIAKSGLALKVLVDQMREQVQNIE